MGSVDGGTFFAEEIAAGGDCCTLGTVDTVTRVPLLPDEGPGGDAAAFDGLGLEFLDERDRNVLAVGMAGTTRAP